MNHFYVAYLVRENTNFCFFLHFTMATGKFRIICVAYVIFLPHRVEEAGGFNYCPKFTLRMLRLRVPAVSQCRNLT
jgi:hypothetical protein